MMYYKKIENKNTNEWIVLLHGLCGNSAMWASQILSFNKKYNVLLIDLPSHGNSENVITKCNITSMDEIAKLIIDILDESNIPKAHFAGISLGTLVVGKIYQLYPERISSIVMCGAVACFGILQHIGMNIFGTTSKLFDAKTMAKLWINVILDKKERKKIKNLFIQQSKLISRPDTRRWIDIIVKEHKLLFNLDYSKINILFIMGDHDKLFLNPVKKLKDKFQNIKLEVIKNAGHVCNAHKPEEFNEISLNFLAKV